MKQISALFFGLMMITMSLSGCFGGDDAVEEPDDPVDEQIPTTGGELDEDWNVHFAATSGDLPECSAATLGRLYYVDADSEFQACMPTGWQTIEITGPAGIAGPPGSSATLEEGCFNTETGTKYAVAMLMPDEEDLKLLCEGFAWEFNEGDGVVSGYCHNELNPIPVATGDNYDYTESECSWISPAYDWYPGGEEDDSESSGMEWKFAGYCNGASFDYETWPQAQLSNVEGHCSSFRWVEEQTGFWECVNSHATVTAQLMVNEMDMPTCESFKWQESSSESTPMNGINGVSPLITSDYSDMCPSGGSTFKIGMDIDSNGILDSMEIITSLDICNGINGKDGQDGLNGTDGQDGADGADGLNGADGTSVNIVGSVATVGDLDSSYQGNIGDGYIVSSTGHLHIWDGSAWVDAGNITGPDGADGADGVDGDDGAAGVDGDDGATGVDGADGADGVDGDDGAAGVDGDDGAAGVDGDDGSNTLISTTTEPAGSNCANGGTRIDMGVDDDGDGTLDTTEIDHTQYICDGSDGSASANTMLTSISTPTLTACDAGGRIMKQGLDNGDGGGTAQNGILETGEVDYTTTYCSNYLIGMLKDINSGSADSDLTQITAVGNILYFRANDGINGIELWKSDGTAAGTMMVKDINSGTGNSYPNHFTAFGDTLYFQATDGTNGEELWKSDGSSSGTVMVKDINSGASGSNVFDLTIIGNTLYFQATDGTTNNGKELWKSDGTSAGTVMVKDINSGSSGSNPSELTAVGSTLFFQAYDSTNHEALWKSDGTTAGTVMVKDIYTGTMHQSGMGPIRLTAVGNTLFFMGIDDEIYGGELWKSDGTTSGTVLVKDIYSNPAYWGSEPSELTAVGNTLYFNADDGTNGKELWKSDGTSSGTVMVKDIRPGTDSSTPSYLTVVGNTLYFSAYYGTDGWSLWKSNGTTTGTVMVKDIDATSTSNIPSLLTAVGNTLYFNANDGTNGYELWQSDGTTAGTVMVKDINSGSSSGSPSGLTAVGNTLYFEANDGTNGDELWMAELSSDGAGVIAYHEITYS